MLRPGSRSAGFLTSRVACSPEVGTVVRMLSKVDAALVYLASSDRDMERVNSSSQFKG